MPKFATLYLPLFSIFLCPILPLFSTVYISLWDAMNKLWCGPIGNEFKRWRVGINKGGGEIDGHKENSQHFRANFKKGIFVCEITQDHIHSLSLSLSHPHTNKTTRKT
jgi:hypothetical protein